MNSNVELVRSHEEGLTKAFSSFIEKYKGMTQVVGLCGGRSILPFLKVLQPKEISQGLRFFFVDERLVPIDHPDSNYNSLKAVFFDKLSHAEIFPFYFFKGSDETLKEKLLDDYQQSFEDEGGRFDLLILGVGEDGHVASLFPNKFNAYMDKECYFYIEDSPKPPKERMTISPIMLQEAQAIVLLFMGQSKRQALENFLSEGKTIYECPAKLALACEKVLVLSDIL